MKTKKFIGTQTTMGAGVFETVLEGHGVSAELNTHGDGIWSDQVRKVSITGIALPYVSDEDDVEDDGGDVFGSVNVYFDTNTWDTSQHGLIYTDSGFLAELKLFLNTLGLDGSDLHYSEQGAQGDNYVNLDAGSKFITSWKKLDLSIPHSS
jgi:hypothetical protein